MIDVIRRVGRAAPVAQIVILVAVWSAFGAWNSDFLDSGSVFAVLQGFAFLGLVTVGIGVTIVAGELDLSVGSVAAVAGIIAVKALSLGLFPAILLAVIASAIFGFVQGSLIARLRINSLVFTIGTMLAVRGIAFAISERAVQVTPDQLDLSDSLIARILVFSPTSLVTIAVLILLGMVLAYSPWGREIYAIGGGRAEAIAAGVAIERPIKLAFTLSAGLAGLAGAMASLSSGSGAPFAFENLLLGAVTAALIGGISLYGGHGSVLQMALGALILQTFSAGLSAQGTPQNVQQLATGALLLVVILMEFATRAREASAAGGKRSRRWARLSALA